MALGPPRTRRRRHRRRRDGPRQDGADMRLPRRARRRAAATAARCRVFARRGDASVGIDFGPDDDALALAPRVEQMGSKGQSRGTPPVRDQLRRRRSSGPSATGFISGPSFIAAAARRSVRGFVRHLRGVVRLFAPFGRGFAAEEVGLRRAGRGPTDPEPARAHHAAVQARAHGSSSAALGHARAEFSPRTLVPLRLLLPRQAWDLGRLRSRNGNADPRRRLHQRAALASRARLSLRRRASGFDQTVPPPKNQARGLRGRRLSLRSPGKDGARPPLPFDQRPVRPVPEHCGLCRGARHPKRFDKSVYGDHGVAQDLQPPGPLRRRPRGFGARRG
mmetsp:Transcript_12694/g.42374  ORF Transcript_12694/g.42374 Transcript_12694/m.42374 type:complete len:334 (+) Transcript_12694:259-1260(+)